MRKNALGQSWIWAVLVVVIGLVISEIFFILYFHSRQEANARLLNRLNAASEGSIVRMRFLGQRREVIVTERAILDYIALAVATQRRPNTISGGVSYDAHLKYRDGSDSVVAFYITQDDKNIQIGYPIGWDSDYRFEEVHLPEPLPDDLVKILDFLRADPGEAAGWALVVDESGVRKVPRPEVKAP